MPEQTQTSCLSPTILLRGQTEGAELSALRRPFLWLCFQTEEQRPSFLLPFFFAWAIGVRGTILRRLKDFNEAIDNYLKAVELCTDREESGLQEAQKQMLLTYNDFAVHCYAKGFYEEAVLLLNKAIKGEKSEKGLYINRGGKDFVP